MGSKDFLGGGLKFPLQVDPKTGKIAMVYHEEDIREAIGIIIGTYQGERVMRPGFGTKTADYLFEPVSSDAGASLCYELQQELTLQEPRIKDVSVTRNQSGADQGTLLLEVSYTVRSTNNRYNQVYPFYTQEGWEEENT